MSGSTALALLRVARAAFLAFFVASVGLLVSSAPAHADGAALSVDPTTDLDPAGTSVTVKGSGYEPNIGLFVVVCDPTVPKGGACDMANFQQAKTDADGAFEVKLKTVAVFGQTDCAKTPCGIQTSKVGDGANRTQERTVPIGFSGGVAPADGWPGVGSADADPGAATTPGADTGEDTQTDQTADKADDSSSSTPIVIGAIVVALAIGAGVVFARRRRQPTDTQ